MKIAVTAAGGSLNAQLEPRFNRCAYFVVVDSETMKSAVFGSPASELSAGNESAAVRELVRRRVEVLLTRRIDERTRRLLETADIRVEIAGAGTVREALKSYLLPSALPA